jgi:hypothetical protein
MIALSLKGFSGNARVNENKALRVVLATCSAAQIQTTQHIHEGNLYENTIKSYRFVAEPAQLCS